MAKYLPSRESGEGNIPKATIHRVEKNNCFCKQFIHRPQINSVTVNAKRRFESFKIFSCLKKSQS